jgi:hypothetical protein
VSPPPVAYGTSDQRLDWAYVGVVAEEAAEEAKEEEEDEDGVRRVRCSRTRSRRASVDATESSNRTAIGVVDRSDNGCDDDDDDEDDDDEDEEEEDRCLEL